MKKNLALPGLTVLIFFSACQKQNDFKGDFKNNSDDSESATSSRGSGNYWGSDNGYGDMSFYLLGEGNKLDRYSSDRYERKGSVAIT